MRFKHLIWDYDGTLFDSYPIMANAFEDTLKEYGIIEPANAIMSFLKVSMGDTEKHYGEKYQLDDAFWERFAVLKKNAEMENTKPFDGVIELCNAVCEHGGKNYLLTHRGESAIYFMGKYRLLTKFTELITSEQNFPRKPSPEAILYLMNKYEFSRDDAIIIGDRDIDILSGNNAGIHTCYFTNQDDKSNIGEFNINCFSALYKILDVGHF